MSGPFGSSQWMYNAGSDYELEQSLRFNDGDSAYMHKTPGSAGNRRTFTVSVWFKQTNSGADSYLFSTGTYASGDGFFQIKISSSGRI